MITAIYRLVRRLPTKRRARMLGRLSRWGLERRLELHGHIVYRHENRYIGVDLADHVGRQMFKHGWYESAYIDFIREHLGDRHGTFVDVGANIGNHSLALAPWFRHTIAFEPNPDIFPLLKANCERNPDLSITPIQQGLSSRHATLDFYSNTTGNAGQSGFEAHDSDSQALSLTVAPGDDLIRSNQTVAAIKIDVEGHELEVLKGLKRTIQRDRPFVFLEWHTESMQRHGGFPALHEALPQAYHLLFSSDRLRVRLEPVAPPYKRKYNLIFCIPADRIDALEEAPGPLV